MRNCIMVYFLLLFLCVPIVYSDFLISDSDSQYPAISGNIVVWQDDLGGTWDIFGYNITTGEEFEIYVDEFSNQKNPAISGNTVVWEDDRDGPWRIYAMTLDGWEIADCDVNLVGDLNGDCIVDMRDLAKLSSNWLRDELVISY